MRIAVFIATLLIELATAIFGLFIVLLGLNGFSERQATPSLIFYIVFCVATSLLFAYLATVAANTIVSKRRLGKVPAAIVSILITSVVEVGMVVVAGVVSLILAELSRGLR